jgi:hypothetical protein
MKGFHGPSKVLETYYLGDSIDMGFALDIVRLQPENEGGEGLTSERLHGCGGYQNLHHTSESSCKGATY